MKPLRAVASFAVSGVLTAAGVGCTDTGPTTIRAGGADSSAVGQPSPTLTGIADSCASSVGADGFGQVAVKGDVRSANETVDITVPCRLVLEPGASLTLNRARVTSGHLVIRDGDVAGANKVRIENSELHGRTGSGFLLDLKDADDSFGMVASTVGYDASVWVRVVGNREDSEGGGRVEAVASTVRSVGAASEGIQLVAGDTGGGRASFVNLVLETTDEDGPLLLAEQCHAERVTGAPAECTPPTEGS